MKALLADVAPHAVTGSVARLIGTELEIRGLRLRIGDAVTVHARSGDRPAEVVGIDASGARALLFSDRGDIGAGDRVSLRPLGIGAVMSEDLVGRVVDGLGAPLDGGPPLRGERVRLDGDAPAALDRGRVDRPLPVGVRAIDTLCTVGRGQRMGIFAGSGVGKSTLLGMMARGTAADVNVVALVGERGREVREFLEDELDEAGRRRTVAVVATSDQSPLMRLRAAFLATRVAEWFADAGRDVLLLMDSLTRLAMAQREIGLAAGEPPTARGYTPSVFTLLPRLLERAGPRPAGTVTAFYTVLVEGDDFNEPIADAARSVLDGHIVLDRRIAISGRYPAIDPLASLSRLADRLAPEGGAPLAVAARDALAAAAEVQELVEVGAYVAGSNPAADRGLAARNDLIAFLRQGSSEAAGYDESWERLRALAPKLGLE